MKIFVSGRYTADTAAEREQNVKTAARVGTILMNMGHVPFVPHLMHYADEVAAQFGYVFGWADWMAQCKEWLKTCDALLQISPSRGSDIEVQWATELGISVYRSIQEIPPADTDWVPVSKNVAAAPAALEVPIHKYYRSACLPFPATPGSAAVDLFAYVIGTGDWTIAPGEVAIIYTGLSVAIPDGYAGLILPRSGVASKHGVVPVNAPGLIDADYRGEIRLAMINLGKSTFSYTHGMRLAQLLLVPTARIAWKEVDTLPETARGSAGFGSTGE